MFWNFCHVIYDRITETFQIKKTLPVEELKILREIFVYFMSRSRKHVHFIKI